jgi:hypothetical protein
VEVYIGEYGAQHTTLRRTLIRLEIDSFFHYARLKYSTNQLQ